MRYLKHFRFETTVPLADHGWIRGHWNGVPVFLVKPRGDRQPFRTSELPVSLCDLPSSIFDALAIEHDFECESIFSAEAGGAASCSWSSGLPLRGRFQAVRA